ncbi:hypothetical protein BH10ACI3_BH10ACI3_26160 [soil metagenome]
MADLTNNRTNLNPNKFNRQTAVAINYTSRSISSQPKDEPRFDDLIVSLANAHENRRARQVNEWERMRQPYVYLNA